MKNWEYRFYYFDIETYLEDFNRLGMQGWEFVMLLDSAPFYCIFKRPIAVGVSQEDYEIGGKSEPKQK